MLLERLGLGRLAPAPLVVVLDLPTVVAAAVEADVAAVAAVAVVVAVVAVAVVAVGRLVEEAEEAAVAEVVRPFLVNLKTNEVKQNVLTRTIVRKNNNLL